MDGQRVTTLARTVLDLLRTLTMERSVTIGDAALRLGLTLEELAEVAGRCIGWRGMLQARRAMNFLDARSESAGESYSRVILDQIGMPRPIPQYEVWNNGLLVGRADFGWVEFRTLGEFDGKEKYGRMLKPGQTPADAVFAEKRREDALRDLGGRSSAGSGKTCTTQRSCGHTLERAFQRGLRGLIGLTPPLLLRALPSCLAPHLYVTRQGEGRSSAEEAGVGTEGGASGEEGGSFRAAITRTRKPLAEAARSQV